MGCVSSSASSSHDDITKFVQVNVNNTKADGRVHRIVCKPSTTTREFASLVNEATGAKTREEGLLRSDGRWVKAHGGGAPVGESLRGMGDTQDKPIVIGIKMSSSAYADRRPPTPYKPQRAQRSASRDTSRDTIRLSDTRRTSTCSTRASDDEYQTTTGAWYVGSAMGDCPVG
mmetsp:Transcript_34078/g.84285  ORF Transcript_34078/g.84285 Transcript_34078/m.84285 type:complete len:173 (-) Transcript_34078:366-884(-)